MAECNLEEANLMWCVDLSALRGQRTTNRALSPLSPPLSPSQVMLIEFRSLHSVICNQVLVALEGSSCTLPRDVLEDGAVSTPCRGGRVDAVESERQRLGVMRPIPVDQTAVLRTFRYYASWNLRTSASIPRQSQTSS